MSSFRVEALSRVCYEAGRAYAQATGDRSMPAWLDADEDTQRDMMTLVRAVLARPDEEPGFLSDLMELSATSRFKRAIAVAIVRAAIERPVLA